MDSYQAIYDAARRQIPYFDPSIVDRAIRESFQEADHAIICAVNDFKFAAYEMARPSAIFKPRIFLDGNQWCALYGENLQDGVAGFGESPAKAMDAFDASWNKAIDSAMAAAPEVK